MRSDREGGGSAFSARALAVSVAFIVVIFIFRPVITRPRVAEADAADLFQMLDTVFEGRDQPQRRAMIDGERLSVDFVAEQGLGVHGVVHAEANVVLSVWRLQTHVARQTAVRATRRR